jgi:hypothetical protein
MKTPPKRRLFSKFSPLFFVIFSHDIRQKKRKKKEFKIKLPEDFLKFSASFL